MGAADLLKYVLYICWFLPLSFLPHIRIVKKLGYFIMLIVRNNSYCNTGNSHRPLKSIKAMEGFTNFLNAFRTVQKNTRAVILNSNRYLYNYYTCTTYVLYKKWTVVI